MTGESETVLSGGAPILSVSHVWKRFGAVTALADVSLDLYRGEALALVGDNGAGKSTLARIIGGVHRASEGRVAYDGETVAFQSPRDARHAGIEMIHQDLALVETLDVASNIFLGREVRSSRLGWLGVLDHRTMTQASKKALRDLNIDITDVGRIVYRFSGGQRQSIAITRAIYWDARVIIMDEPTAALGVPEQKKVKDLVTSLRSRGVGVVYISHNLADVFDVCDRIAVLRRGKLVGDVAADNTTMDAVVAMIVGAQ